MGLFLQGDTMFDNIMKSIQSHQEEGIYLPKPKRVRIQQLDADSTCYTIANPDVPLKSNISSLYSYVNSLRLRADCKYTNLHTTLALKGGREQVSMFQPYQGKRQHGDEAYKTRVNELRHALTSFRADWLLPYPQYFVEADDSMTIEQEKRIRETGDVFSSVISTDDKDLNSSLGVVQNITTGKFTLQGKFDNGEWSDMYGETHYDADSKKLVGRGTSFFWWQMVAGDPVDFIKGLPLVPVPVLNLLDPIKKPEGRRPKPVAYGGVPKLMQGVKTDQAAARRVYMMYIHYSAVYGDPWLFEEMAILLWMQRNPTPYDVYDYLNNVCGLHIIPHPVIKKRIETYATAIQLQLQKLQRGS